VPADLPKRPLIFVAHPDDESLACGGLLQRVETALVVFATDGAAPGFGGDRISGSIEAYSDTRFLEASRALAHLPHALFQRLMNPDGSYFVEVHLFEELPDAFASLCAVARSFSPDAIVSHTYEGAHLDHDACSFLAAHAATELSLPLLEFPLYWLDANGTVIRQKFRDCAITAGSATKGIELHLSESEVDRKRKMLAEYGTQRGTVSSFAPEVERFRLAAMPNDSFRNPQCRDYMFQERRPRFYHTRRHRLPAKHLLKKFSEFEAWRREPADKP
jgi:LmbE family N-acetylglucosaminyl deacetylase